MSDRARCAAEKCRGVTPRNRVAVEPTFRLGCSWRFSFALFAPFADQKLYAFSRGPEVPRSRGPELHMPVAFVHLVDLRHRPLECSDHRRIEVFAGLLAQVVQPPLQ